MFFTNISGAIKSPNYPQPYPRESSCLWSVSFGPQLMTIRAVDFDLPPPINATCRDFVHISTGVEPYNIFMPTPNSPNTYCGSTIPNINIQDRNIHIQFEAPPKFNFSGYRGFQINFAINFLLYLKNLQKLNIKQLKVFLCNLVVTTKIYQMNFVRKSDTFRRFYLLQSQSDCLDFEGLSGTQSLYFTVFNPL